jgi:hypothetical protein
MVFRSSFCGKVDASRVVQSARSDRREESKRTRCKVAEVKSTMARMREKMR